MFANVPSDQPQSKNNISVVVARKASKTLSSLRLLCFHVAKVNGTGLLGHDHFNNEVKREPASLLAKSV